MVRPSPPTRAASIPPRARAAAVAARRRVPGRGPRRQLDGDTAREASVDREHFFQQQGHAPTVEHAVVAAPHEVARLWRELDEREPEQWRPVWAEAGLAVRLEELLQQDARLTLRSLRPVEPLDGERGGAVDELVGLRHRLHRHRATERRVPFHHTLAGRDEGVRREGAHQSARELGEVSPRPGVGSRVLEHLALAKHEWIHVFRAGRLRQQALKRHRCQPCKREAGRAAPVPARA